MRTFVGVHDGSGNLACQYNVVRGDVDAAFARAALVHEDTYETHSQYPAYLEPMVTLGTGESITLDGPLDATG